MPVDKTIDIILRYVYHHPSLPPLRVEKEILSELLTICTKKIPFRHPSGELFQQIDGVAMGSPLGPTFAGFYMGHLESEVFQKMEKPIIYARYVDDIILMCHDISGLQRLKDEFEKNSVLTFSYEVSDIKQQLAFLDVLITRTANGFHTGVYIKPTEGGACMNGDSTCPEGYKKRV